MMSPFIVTDQIKDKIFEIVWDRFHNDHQGQPITYQLTKHIGLYLKRKGYVVFEDVFDEAPQNSNYVYIKLYANSTRSWLELPNAIAEQILILNYLPDLIESYTDGTFHKE